MGKGVILLGLLGVVLQWTVGKVDASFLAFPWGLVAAVNYLYLLILLRLQADRWNWVGRLFDRPAYLTALASMLGLTLLFGLIPQDGSSDGWTGALGLTDMTTSWIFNLFLLAFLTVVGLKAVDDVWHWRQRRLPNVVMHAAFFVVLAAAIFGSGDQQRVRVMTALDKPAMWGVTPEGRRVDLPFTLVLKKFTLEEYPLPEGADSMWTRREVKKYLSEVEVITEDEKRRVEIAVNHPASIGPWKIYQYSYDVKQGRMSQISVLECVKDGWYVAVHIGLWLVMAGGVMLFVMGWSRRKTGKEETV